MYYPPVGFYFTVEFIGLNGITDNDIRFQEVSGLNAEINVQELKEGGENRFAHKLPNAARYNNLTLKRGMLIDSALIKWFRDAVESFEFNPVSIKVSLLNEEGQPLSSWNLTNAYPIKWTLSNFNSTQNEVVIETVEIAYNYFTRS